MRPYEKTGGKIIFWGGVSDPCCSFINFEQLFQDATRILDNDPNRLASFAKYYEVPGMGHCGGGTGPDDGADQLLMSLVEWVEHGRAPQAVVTHRGADRAQLAFTHIGDTMSGVHVGRSTGAPRDFLLCPYPQVSVFDRSKAATPGAVFEAANWSCRTSRD
jgi:feruloyl esterase